MARPAPKPAVESASLLPVVALVGRPNVGKSTLFNCLTASRDALVSQQAGTTRDRQYGMAGRGRLVVVDTGGLGDADDINAQAELAIAEADLVVLMVDSRQGLNPDDERIAARLRSSGAAVIIAANKVDGRDPQLACADFHRLGMGAPLPLTASQGRGVGQLLRTLMARLPPPTAEPEQPPERLRIALLGRPNVGKSTLANRLLGQARLLVRDAPGTTRDSIWLPLDRAQDDGTVRKYCLIDTAGIRRHRRRGDLEQLSVIKSLQALAQAQVVLYMLDADEGVVEQDLRLLGHCLESGRALVLLLNKWDLLERPRRKAVREELQRRLSFLDFAAVHQVSALRTRSWKRVFAAIDEAWASANCKPATALLNKILAEAVERHRPPRRQGLRAKLRYAHCGGSNPPLVVVHGNRTESLSADYRRYLENHFRKRLEMRGAPLRVQLRTQDNPYKKSDGK